MTAPRDRPVPRVPFCRLIPGRILGTVISKGIGEVDGGVLRRITWWALASVLGLWGCEDAAVNAPGAFACSASVGCQTGFTCLDGLCAPAPANDAGGSTDTGGPVPDGAADPPPDAARTPDAAPNPDAAEADAGEPDAGAEDRDGDGVPDDADNCPQLADPDQTDTDGDGLGDACDPNPRNADFRLTGSFLLFGGLVVDEYNTVRSGGYTAHGRSTDGVFTLKGSLTP